eukprot:CAMPEP_0168779262 /NCGR_PEP_ID=MMETSP0725-20121227/7510_1 /TAXON_ID=265536 /ORGANISM="Amphiprora sp., Strain CCMP467" /LENGTH=556 /DNA_ID=CAMNT_0008829063 /DNA_START=49 /DNA_END=1719 /DNA_ORIENTATION=-
MDANYSDNDDVGGSSLPSSTGGIQPFETSHQDDEEEGVSGAHFHDDEFTGEAHVFRSENDAALSSSRRRKQYCHPYNKYILLGGAIFVACALGAGISVSNNRNDESVATTPSPTSMAPSAATTPAPTNAPTLTQTQPAFLPILDTVYPPSEPDDSLPQYVNPARNFGHLVAMDAFGSTVVVAMKSAEDDPFNYYGAFYYYKFTPLGGAQWQLLATLYDQLSATPTQAQHHQSVSVSGDGDRVAFTQGEQVAVWLTAALDPNEFTHLGDNIADFGPDDGTPGAWYAVALALSPISQLLGVIVTDGNETLSTNTTSLLEIYHYREVHTGNGGFEDKWTRVAQLPLPSRAIHGSISFDFLDKSVAVGTFDGSVESVSYYALATNDDITSWASFGDPMTAAFDLVGTNQVMGGSVVSLSGDGTRMAIGSIYGIANSVVLLQWDPSTSSWKGYGTNNILEGESQFSNFGASIQFNKEGTRVFVGAPAQDTAGKIFIYQYFEIENEWREFTDPIRSDEPGDMMGSTIAVNEYGNRVVAGLPKRSIPQLNSTKGAFQTFVFEE